MAAIGIGVGVSFSRRVGGIPSILSDGNTKAWYDKDENITKDGSDLVSVWGDKSGNGNDLEQLGLVTLRPLWSADEILFDGVSHYMKTGTFTLSQPTFIYMVVKQVTWVADRKFFDGFTNNTGRVEQYNIGASPQLVAHAGGTPSPANSNLAVGAYGILRVLYNGANCSFQINATAKTSGNYGSGDMAGFSLACRASGASRGNIGVKEIIIRSVADSDADSLLIYNYLKSKYSL